jgi:hypothetical protein
MSNSVKQIIEAFQRLTPVEQREAASVILRSVADLDYSPLDDAALAQIADQSFQEYDAREAAQNDR